jgi:hypothetical protein
VLFSITGFHRHAYYENGQQAYDDFHKHVYYMNGTKAYDGFFKRAHYPNGQAMGSNGSASEPGLQMFLNGPNGDFMLNLGWNFYMKVFMSNGNMRVNLFMDGQCVVAQ